MIQSPICHSSNILATSAAPLPASAASSKATLVWRETDTPGPLPLASHNVFDKRVGRTSESDTPPNFMTTST